MIFLKNKFINFLLRNYQENPWQLFILLSLFSSLFALISAYISQYIFGFEPCILCLYQRKPFFIIIIISVIFLFTKKIINWQKIGAIFCCLLFLINAGIAFYHSGVELKIFEGPKNCSTSNFDNVKNLEELTNLMMSTKAVRCDEPQFYFLKLTMANWNFIYCLMILMIGIFMAKIRVRNS